MLRCSEVRIIRQEREKQWVDCCTELGIQSNRRQTEAEQRWNPVLSMYFCCKESRAANPLQNADASSLVDVLIRSIQAPSTRSSSDGIRKRMGSESRPDNRNLAQGQKDTGE